MNTKEVLCVLVFTGFSINLLSQTYRGGSCLSGNCSNGYGTFAYESGEVYVGNFSQNKRNGYGEYTFKNGAVYKGNWKNDLKEDKNGVYISKTIHYTGSFENDYISGYGTLKYVSGKRKEDSYTGSFIKNLRQGKGEYYYSSDSDKINYIGEFKNDKFNGQGVLTYKNGEKWDGFWKDDEFLGTKIGEYQEQDVVKKGDTIITYNNKYLLSAQTPLPNNGYNILLNENVLQDGFFIEVDMKGQRQIIGYVTTTSQRSNSTIFGGNENFAENAEGCKFHEIKCDGQKELYKKFMAYCDKRIKKHDNTVNVFSKSYEEYEKIIDEDIALNNRIIRSKLSDIAIQVTSDLLDVKIRELSGKVIDDKIKNKEIAEYIKELGFDPLNTTVKDYLVERSTDIFVYPWKLIGNKEYEVVTNVKDCATKAMRTVHKSTNNSPETDYLDVTLTDWAQNQFRDKNHNLLETEEAKFIKIMRDMIDDCIPSKTAFVLKKHWLYHLSKNSPEIGEAIGLVTANVTIKYSIAPETKKMFADHVQQSKERRDLLIGLKDSYAQILAKNKQGECQGLFEVMYEMHTRTKNPVGATHIIDELNLLHKEIFVQK